MNPLKKCFVPCSQEKIKSGQCVCHNFISNSQLENSDKKNKFVIIDLRNMDYMKDDKGEIIYYDTLEKASTVCGMYEFEDAWVCQLIYNYKKENLIKWK